MPKFKVGDTVRIRDESQFFYQKDLIGIGRVVQVFSYGMPYAVQNKLTKYRNSYNENDLEKAYLVTKYYK